MNEDKIEVGEYVRTNRGKFGICISVSNVTGRYCQPKYLIQWSKAEAYYITKQTITKHSKNIIDLIKVGDIVEIVINEINGYTNKVETVNEEQIEILKTANKKYIKSIVTKEQFESLEYKV